MANCRDIRGPDANNKYVAKLTDMHVAGVREIDRAKTQSLGLTADQVFAALGAWCFLAGVHQLQVGVFDRLPDALWQVAAGA